MAKFGIALEWGSRGHGFKSRHSDQKKTIANVIVFFNGINHRQDLWYYNLVKNDKYNIITTENLAYKIVSKEVINKEGGYFAYKMNVWGGYKMELYKFLVYCHKTM